MRDFFGYVSGIEQLMEEAHRLPLGNWPELERPPLPPDAPRVLLFSPHPDDEVITGAWPLRLMRQGGARVVNVAVTLGSKKERQQERLRELEGCCRHLGFDLVTADAGGLERVNLKQRRDDPRHWIHGADALATLIKDLRPVLLFAPHASDGNATHMGVHALVHHALMRVGSDFACHVAETEYWAPMETPNLLVESTAREVADLLSALSFHVGELKRNPYHITLPAWMVDNIRRGAELIQGAGSQAPRFTYGTLYRVRRWTGEKFATSNPAEPFLAMNEDPWGPIRPVQG